MDTKEDLANFIFSSKDNRVQYFQRRIIEKLKAEIIEENVSAIVCLNCHKDMQIISVNSVGIASECPQCNHRTIVHFAHKEFTQKGRTPK